MSYLKSSFSVCVLEVSKEDKLSSSDIYQKLSCNFFQELLLTAEFGHGWVAINDVFKNNFDMTNICVDNYIYGGYRFDRKIVPQALIKKLFRDKLREKQRAGEKLNKVDKKILKEECKTQLVMKTLPKPNLVSWIWDLENSKIYLDTKSPKIIDSFLSLFLSTFEKTDIKVSDLGLESDSLEEFLEWMWINVSKTEDITIDNDIVLDSGDKTLFKFNGPSLGIYLPEIETLKNSKLFKSFTANLVIDELDYKVGFNSKHPFLSVKIVEKIKHESVETAVLDNVDRIQKILEKVKILINNYLEV